ncbi:MAG: MMPL family transporter [Patulibacter sp.]|nr:MMPL family transporter [Patulibacter sp.]
MLGRLLALATRVPRATLGVLVLLAVVGGVVGSIVPVDGRLDRLAPSGSDSQKAGETERTSFGGDTATIVIRGDMVQTLRSADIVTLAGLEGCLAGAAAKDAKGPCATIRDLNGVVSVQGPATYVNTALVEIQQGAQNRIAAVSKAATDAQTRAEALAKKRGYSKAQIDEAGKAALQVTQVRGLAALAQYANSIGLGGALLTADLTDKAFVAKLLFAKGTDNKLGPKRRLAWLIPNRQTALMQVNLVGNLSAGKRAKVTKALQAALENKAFRLNATKATLSFTGLAPATQTLSDAIRRSALALGAAALVVMAAVLLLARRLRRRLLPVLVAAAVLGTALMVLAIPTGALSLAVVVALPVLVGLAVDQAVQAQLRLERRLHPGALRTLVIAGAGAAASALALLASPFGVVRTVSVALAAAILVAIVLAAVASAAAISLTRKAQARATLRTRGAPNPPHQPTAFTQAVHDADELVGSSAPVRAGTAAGRRLSAVAARMTRPAAIAVVAIGILVAVAGAALGTKTKVQTDLTALVPAKSAGAKELTTLRSEIGTASTVSLVVKTKNVEDPELWRFLTATQRSVTAGRSGRCDGQGLCTPLPLDELFGTTGKALPTDTQVATALAALPQAIQRGLIDPKRGVIALPFGIGTLDGARQRVLVQQLDKLAAAAPKGSTAQVSGLPAVVAAGADALESPGRRALLAALALLLPGLVLLATLRSFRRTVVALVPPAFALGWSELAMWALGVPRTPLTAALGVLVAAVAVEFSVLLGERYAALRKVGLARERAITATLRETGGAVAISAGATIAGFAILGLASIPVISQFGIATAVDLAVVLIALVAVGPATWVLSDREPAAAAPAPRPVAPERATVAG